MSLTRKRKRELKRLRSSAQDLWGQQQQLLDRANIVAREASKQAGHVTREEVVPRVREGYDSYVRPKVESGTQYAGAARDRVTDTVIPAVSSVITTALAVADRAQDVRDRAYANAQDGAKKASKQVEDLQKRAGKAQKGVGKNASKKWAQAGKNAAKAYQQTTKKLPKSVRKNLPEVKSGPGIGTYVGLGIAIVAAAAMLYAVWQTFRADDELWVSDEGTTESSTPTSSVE